MVTIQINEDSNQARQFISYVKTLPFATVKSDKKPSKLRLGEIKYLAELQDATKQAKYGVSRSLDEVLNEI